jgi:hypothetical protein
MVKWVKGLMKLPILKPAINMGLLRTHATVRNNIKLRNFQGNHPMNHPIFKAATNVGLLRTHPSWRGSIKIEGSSRRREYATLIWECNNERQSFIKGKEAWGFITKITTSTLGNREQTSLNHPHDCLLW